MSKAEDRAIEKYPIEMYEEVGWRCVDKNAAKREYFIEGYNQAEKDLYKSIYKAGVLDGFEDAVEGQYEKGYEQAEKDLLANKHEKSWRLDEKLWKGIKDVEEASYQYTYDASNDWAYDVPTWDDVQDAFKAGSEWKEGLELTWEDISDIIEIHDDVLEMESCENIYMEVLKQFKERKK